MTLPAAYYDENLFLIQVERAITARVGRARSAIDAVWHGIGYGSPPYEMPFYDIVQYRGTLKTFEGLLELSSREFLLHAATTGGINYARLAAGRVFALRRLT